MKINIIGSLIFIILFSGCASEFKKTIQDSVSQALHPNLHKNIYKTHNIFIDKFPIVIVKEINLNKDDFKEIAMKTMEDYLKNFGKKDISFKRKNTIKFIIDESKQNCSRELNSWLKWKKDANKHDNLSNLYRGTFMQSYNKTCSLINDGGGNCKYLHNISDIINMEKEMYDRCVNKNKSNYIIIQYVQTKENGILPIGLNYYNGKKQFTDVIVSLLIENKIYFIQFNKKIKKFFRQRYYYINNNTQNKILQRLKELKYLK